jgi:hypothetical protein
MNSSESNKSVPALCCWQWGDMRHTTFATNRCCRRVGWILPLAALVCVTGCSTLNGTTGQTALKSRVSTYMQPNTQPPVNPDEDLEGPAYEWWY